MERLIDGKLRSRISQYTRDLVAGHIKSACINDEIVIDDELSKISCPNKNQPCQSCMARFLCPLLMACNFTYLMEITIL